MKQTLVLLTAIAGIISFTILSCDSNYKASEKTEGIAATEISEDSLVNHGRYLVTIMGCNDCHSPKIMGPHGPELDSAHLLSGHPAKMPLGDIDQNSLKSWVLFNPMATAMVGPWGVSFAANISSDASGIGSWTEEQFFIAMREGKYKGNRNGRMLLPPMPWEMTGRASDHDLRSIFAYLKSTQPVENVVPAPIPPTSLAMMH